MMPKRFSLGAFLALPLLAALTLADSGSRTEKGEVRESNSIFVDLGSGVKLEMVRIPAGSFLMGSPQTEKGRYADEEPQHLVKITQPFYLGRYEVTQEQYQKVTGENPSWFSSKGLRRNRVAGMNTARFPVECVSWEEASGFCQQLSRIDAKGRRFRLPTEAEWEYACRAGTTSVFHFGNSLNGGQANCDGEEPYGAKASGPCLGRTAEVGSYRANAWGLYDMHGNVCEWCQDWWGEDYYEHSPRKDPQGPKAGTNRVLRSGSWGLRPASCRAAIRGRNTPALQNGNVGFRVAFRPD